MTFSVAYFVAYCRWLLGSVPLILRIEFALFRVLQASEIYVHVLHLACTSLASFKPQRPSMAVVIHKNDGITFKCASIDLQVQPGVVRYRKCNTQHDGSVPI